MISKYDDAPEHVRKFAFSLMQICLYRELSSYDDPRPLLALGAKAGVDDATQAEALRWLAAQELMYASESSGLISKGTRKAAELYSDYAAKIEATLKPKGASNAES
jgi:hypothetical protein